MSSDRLKVSYTRKLARRTNGGQMSLDLTQPDPSPLMVSRGRYVRFSHRYQCWQVTKPSAAGYMEWRNISANLARCYVAAGLPITK